MARETLAGLREQRSMAELRANREKIRADEAEAALAKLKKDVALKVRDLTAEYEWCDVAKQAMQEVGIEPVKRAIKFELELTFEVEMTVDKITSTFGSSTELDAAFVTVAGLGENDKVRLKQWIVDSTTAYEAGTEAASVVERTLDLDGDISDIAVFGDVAEVMVKNLRDA